MAGGTITAIRPIRANPEVFWISVDGKRAGRVDLATIDRLGVRVGEVWTEPMEASVREAEAKLKAKSYALKAITSRALSSGELTTRITLRGYTPEVAVAVVADLTRVGLLDDAEYARTFVRAQLSRKPAGRVLLLAALRRKKIDGAVAKEAVEEALGGVDQSRQAADLAARRMRTMKAGLEPEVVRRRLFGVLARRGFDPETCREAVDRAMRGSGGGQGRGGRGATWEE